MERKDKEYTEGISLKGGFLKWLENYWYHYKWQTIGVVALVTVVLVCTLQMCSKEENDVRVVYAGSAYLTESEAEGMTQIFEYVMPSDFDGDGKKSAAVSSFYILTEDQIKAIEATTDEDGNRQYVDKSYITSEKGAYDDYLLKGESSILILEPWLYEALLSEERLLPISELGEEYEELSFDGYGVRLVSLPIYKKYKILQKLPEETVICMNQQYIIGRSSKDKVYNFEKEMFKAIIGFTYEGQ